MADPSTANPPTPPPSASTPSTHFDQNPKPPNPPPSKSVPHPGTYVVQLPREQILRYPPPENAAKFEVLIRRKKRRSFCCRCFYFALSLLLLLLAASAVSAGVMYLVFDFKSPNYTVADISIKRVNLTSAAPIFPAFNISIRASNPNGKASIYYVKNGAVNILYDGVELSNGVFPVFYQPRKNATVLRTALTGYDGVLTGAVKTALRKAQSSRKVPLAVHVDAPVKIRVGSAKTWEMTVKVRCDVVVDAFIEKAKIVARECDYSVKWW